MRSVSSDFTDGVSTTYDLGLFPEEVTVPRMGCDSDVIQTSVLSGMSSRLETR